MLEIGIPMHAFDYALISGSEIIVRNANNREKIKTLDDTDRNLTEDMLVICDKNKPVAVAGIMGGEFSGINDNTKTIVFEAANFNGSNIRITSKKLGLRSESSSRFEKGLDPMLCKAAIDRACTLIELTGAGTVVNGEIDINNAKHAKTEIKLRPDSINKFLGTNISKQQMIDILLKLDFKVQDDYVIVPSFRSDVEHEADISEEIARIYGYNNISSTIFCGAATQGMLSPVQQFEKKVVNTMLANSMYEIYTYSFISPKALIC
jgi:phenylalanyl-tRNA synthetase beta chain